MVVLDDGKGDGTKAQVNDVNQLVTRATSHSEEHFISRTAGESYLISTGEADVTKPTLTFLDTEAGIVLDLKNDSTIDVVVTALICSANVAGGIVTLLKNTIEGVLTQNTTVAPVNLNFGSAKVADATSNIWDETGGNGIQGLTNGSILRTFVMPGGPLGVNTEGTIVLTQGKSISVSFANDTGGTIEFECGIRFYYDSQEA